MNKYEYLLVIQGNYGYGYGYEDLDEYARTDRRQALADLKEYRAMGLGYHRLIERRNLVK